jgi:hypothetical protein
VQLRCVHFDVPVGGPGVLPLALIVRGACTLQLSLTPQSAGHYAISLGLSRCSTSDHAILRQGAVK